jgi:hypothetical protein
MFYSRRIGKLDFNDESDYLTDNDDDNASFVGKSTTNLRPALPSHTNIVLRFSDGQVSIARMVGVDEFI